ncbi:MAG: MOSC domain-containing protein [Thermoleophilia bacterium]|nr:MOSC domain-containing protein [Thermoleophilia bacterium]
MPVVSRLSITPVKGLALSDRDAVTLTATGVPENRRFYLVDEAGKLWKGTLDGPLFGVRAETDADGKWLRLTFPDGRVLDGAVELGEPTFTPFWDRPVRAHVVEGPWAGALSELLGSDVRLLRAEEPGGATDAAPVSLLSDASLAELARRAGTPAVDGRRFRMLVHVAGTEPHEEDEWLGHEVRLGGALVRVTKPDARCRMTTRNPDTGIRDFDTLKTIKDYRGVREGSGIDFGVYADVVAPGVVAVGDPVTPVS